MRCSTSTVIFYVKYLLFDSAVDLAAKDHIIFQSVPSISLLNWPNSC